MDEELVDVKEDVWSENRDDFETAFINSVKVPTPKASHATRLQPPRPPTSPLKQLES